MQSKKNIGFYRVGLFGDIVVALHGLYALRLLYPKSKLVVYTNTVGELLYGNFSFIDELINVEHYDYNKVKEHMNSCEFDYFVLTNSNRSYCKLLQDTNAKKIFSFLNFGNFLKIRFKTIFISRDFSRLAQYQRILKLVRSLNPKGFDSLHIDYSAIMIQPQKQHYSFVESFFIKNNIPIKRDKEINNIIMINPFVRSARWNLSLKGWRILAEKLADIYKDYYFIIPTYKDNPKFIFDEEKYSNIYIFQNNHDLLNLAALLKHTLLLISPSTGTSHLANNLNIPMIWLCSQRDSVQWRGNNMKSDFFVLIHKSLDLLTQADEMQIIHEIQEKFICFVKTAKK